MTVKENDRTQLVFIIDRSGSMSGLEKDTVGGFNSVLARNRRQPGECLVTTVLFSTGSTVVHDAQPLDKVPDMTLKDYQPGGCTALLDAMGMAMKHIEHQEDPGRVQFIIITDGEENASREFNLDEIRGMVTRLTEKRGWDFLFLGANMDAIAEAGRMGIRPSRAVDAFADAEGTAVQYEAISQANLEFRCCSMTTPDSEDWKNAVVNDRRRRRNG